MMILSRRLLTIAALWLTVSAAQAQMLPQQLMSPDRPLLGNSFRACVDDFSAGGKLDRAVAQAIGDALLLQVEFVPALRGFPLDGDGYLAEMQVHLNNDCDLFMGVAVQPNSPFPEWASVTRPYADVPFVLAVTNHDYERLGDIAFGSFIGTAVASLGERIFITNMLQRPEAERWKRLPYADNKLMLTRLEDGRLEGMLLWQPALAQLAETEPSVADLKLISLDPVPTGIVQVGALISTRSSYLRSQVDKAIDQLSADGTFDEIMSDMGLGVTP